MGKTCAFFGHRKICYNNDLSKKITELVESLVIEKDVSNFIFGGFGEFDELCHKIITSLQKKYLHIKRLYCVTDEKFLRESKRPKNLRKEDYEQFIYFSPSFDYWYTRIYYRNCEIVENSQFIIFYADNKKDSGAYKTLQYAKKRKKEYINLFE